MKKVLIVLVTVLLYTGISGSEKVNNEKEKAAIKKVITEATEAFRARDYDKIAATYELFTCYGYKG